MSSLSLSLSVFRLLSLFWQFSLSVLKARRQVEHLGGGGGGGGFTCDPVWRKPCRNLACLQVSSSGDGVQAKLAVLLSAGTDAAAREACSAGVRGGNRFSRLRLLFNLIVTVQIQSARL